MAVNLRNTSGAAFILSGGKRVDADEVIPVEGDVSKKSPDDAYLIGDGDNARLYPKATWTHVGGSPKAKSDVPAPDA